MRAVRPHRSRDVLIVRILIDEEDDFGIAHRGPENIDDRRGHNLLRKQSWIKKLRSALPALTASVGTCNERTESDRSLNRRRNFVHARRTTESFRALNDKDGE
ncbi:hypothetical protein [Bradyrhizobium elkanii]|uniref:Uncharacterized protein n=1 Tax=Bradyrhizobium elkanii TaxID=29448 RepID=A0A8I2C7K5_BRAEL|nr:hypothetical protein [Bradyrhizobium elkanii]MBP1297398.1 hypothetical protein [Bradyrhizobium elkanii]